VYIQCAIWCRNLHIFMLSENQLVSLPEDLLSPLSSLSSLSLDHNRITGLPPGLFTNCLNLQDLALNNNHLEKVKRNQNKSMHF
jgi:Leucine-rich repeat (LRR) protein